MTVPSSASGQRPGGPNESGGQETRASTAVELLVSLLHSSSHPRHDRQQQRARTKSSARMNSMDTDVVDTDDVDEMSVLQRKVLYALSSALRGNVDVQVNHVLVLPIS